MIISPLPLPLSVLGWNWEREKPCRVGVYVREEGAAGRERTGDRCAKGLLELCGRVIGVSEGMIHRKRRARELSGGIGRGELAALFVLECGEGV